MGPNILNEIGLYYWGVIRHLGELDDADKGCLLMNRDK